MSRLQRKFLVLSAVLHVLLLSLVFVGPAFTSQPPAVGDLPILDFIPSKLVDDLVFGGGTPGPKPAETPARQPEPSPKPEPIPPAKPAKTPEPKVTTPVPEPDEDDVPELSPAKKTPPARKKPQVDLKPVTHPAAGEKARNSAANRAEQARARQQAWANSVGRSLDNLRGNLSSSTTIQGIGPGSGTGTGGEAYANYAQFVKSVYENAWIPPDDLTDESLVVRVRVTIARDGRVIADRIERSSGHSALDQSVRRVLDRIQFVARFPEGAREPERTFLIEFKPKAKRLMG